MTEPERADRRGALGFLVPSRRVHAKTWCPPPPNANGGGLGGWGEAEAGDELSSSRTRALRLPRAPAAQTAYPRLSVLPS